MNKESENMAERCRQELMRLYQRCPKPEEPAPEPAEDISYTIEERFPEPDLSELEEDCTSPEDTPEEPQYDPQETSSGYIQVNVRTGGDAYPVEGATVTVTSAGDGRRLLMGTAVTDMSGCAARIEVPAPDASLSQAPAPRTSPYSLYDVTVTAAGYFDARSVDIPVFAGITSVQDFAMVPVPLYGRSTDETVTCYNQGPDL